VKIGPAVPEICSRTDRHTDRRTNRNTPLPTGAEKKVLLLDIFLHLCPSLLCITKRYQIKAKQQIH